MQQIWTALDCVGPNHFGLWSNRPRRATTPRIRQTRGRTARYGSHAPLAGPSGRGRGAHLPPPPRWVLRSMTRVVGHLHPRPFQLAGDGGGGRRASCTPTKAACLGCQPPVYGRGLFVGSNPAPHRPGGVTICNSTALTHPAPNARRSRSRSSPAGCSSKSGRRPRLDGLRISFPRRSTLGTGDG